MQIHPVHFDLNLLRVLVALYETRSVSKAADSLGLSQPATSLALQRLRRSLSDPLFVRTRSGMDPTPHCAEIAQAATRALASVNTDVLKVAAFEPRRAERTFTLSMNDIGEMVLLPRIMAHMATEAPGCDVRCETLPLDRLELALESGRVDLAIGLYPDLEKPGFFMQRLFHSSFLCLVRKDHPRVAGERVALRTFLDMSHVVVTPPERSNELFEALLKKERLQRRVQLSLPHFLSVAGIVAATDLIATVPSTIAHHFTRYESVRIVQPPINVAQYAIKQHWHARYHHDSALRWLREQMAALFSERREPGTRKSARHPAVADRLT